MNCSYIFEFIFSINGHYFNNIAFSKSERIFEVPELFNSRNSITEPLPKKNNKTKLLKKCMDMNRDFSKNL